MSKLPCPHCGRMLGLSPSHDIVKCPACEKTFRVVDVYGTNTGTNPKHGA